MIDPTPWPLIALGSIVFGQLLGYLAIDSPRLRAFLLQTSWVWPVAVATVCYRFSNFPGEFSGQLLFAGWLWGLTAVLKADESHGKIDA